MPAFRLSLHSIRRIRITLTVSRQVRYTLEKRAFDVWLSNATGAECLISRQGIALFLLSEPSMSLRLRIVSFLAASAQERLKQGVGSPS
jgi:hypothetical protein